MSVLLFWASAASEVTATPTIATATASVVARELRLETSPTIATATASAVARGLELATGPAPAAATAQTAGLAQRLETTPAIAIATASAPAPTTELSVSATPTAAIATASGVTPATELATGPSSAIATATVAAPAHQLETTPTVATATASAPQASVGTEVSATPNPAVATASATVSGLELAATPAIALAVAGLPAADADVVTVPTPGAFPIAPLFPRTRRPEEIPTEIRVTPDPAVAWAYVVPAHATALPADQAALAPTIDGQLAIPSRYRDGLRPSAGYLQALRMLDPDLPRVATFAWPPRRPLRQNEQLASMQALDGAIDKGRTRVALAGAPGAAQAVEELAEQAVRAIVTGDLGILERLDLGGPARALGISIDAELEYLRAFGASTVEEELRRQELTRRRTA